MTIDSCISKDSPCKKQKVIGRSTSQKPTSSQGAGDPNGHMPSSQKALFTASHAPLPPSPPSAALPSSASSASLYEDYYTRVLTDPQLEERERRFWRESGWDKALDPAKHTPLVVSTAEDFIERLTFGDHMEDMVVFRDGVRKLGMMGSMNAELLNAITQTKTVLQALEAVPAKTLETWDGRIYSFCEANEREPFKNDETDCMLEKRDLLQKKAVARVYIAELRFRRENKVAYEVDDEKTRTLLSRSVRDELQENKPFPIYWDRYNEGVFVGQKHTGSPLHMDQCLWSNVGRNWTGWKLMALWHQNDKVVVDKFYRKLFTPPLKEEEVESLRSAMKIALVRPGDVVVFSGACPHMAMCASEELSLTSYESFINMHPRHVDIFCKSNDKAVHPPSFHMSRRTLDDIKEEVGEAVNDMLDQAAIARHPRASHALVDTAEFLRRQDPLFRNEIRSSKRIKESQAAQGYEFRKVLLQHPDGRKCVLEHVNAKNLKAQLKKEYGDAHILQYFDSDFKEFCDLSDHTLLPPLPRLRVTIRTPPPPPQK